MAPRKKTEEPTVEDEVGEDITDEEFLHAVSEPVEDDETLANWPTARPLPPGQERPQEKVEVRTEQEFVEEQLGVLNPFDERTEAQIDPAHVVTEPHPTTAAEVAKVGVNLTNDVPVGRGPEPPRQAIIAGDKVLIYNEQIQAYQMVDAIQAASMPRDGYGVPHKELHSPLDETEHATPEQAVHFQEPHELANNVLRLDPQETPKFTKAARLKQIKAERALLEGQRALTTDTIILARVAERLNHLANEEEGLKYAPATVDGPVAFGHGKSRAFSTPVLGGTGQITFREHVFITEDPMEIASIRRVIDLGSQGDHLVELEAGQRPYFSKDGQLLGWEKDNSPNVKLWLKQNMLRAY